MNNKYNFTIETNPNYYNRLLEITKEATIGKVWGLRALVRAIVMTFGVFIVVKSFGHEFSLKTTFYIWIAISVYYLFRMYKFSKDLKEEYSTVNLSTRPKKITLTISENDIILYEDNKAITITWNDINGFDEKEDGLLIEYLDGQLLMIDIHNLESEKYQIFIDLIKSKLAEGSINDPSSSFLPLIAAFVTAVLGIIMLYIFGYSIYNVFLNINDLILVTAGGTISIVILFGSFFFFYISRREWRSWKEQRSSNKTQEPI